MILFMREDFLLVQKEEKTISMLAQLRVSHGKKLFFQNLKKKVNYELIYFLYKIRVQGSISPVMTLGKSYTLFARQKEICFSGGITPEYIESCVQ